MERTGISVSELNLIIQESIRKDPRIRNVTVTGEVSGFRHYIASGHWYFTLKDSESVINCVMFRQNTVHAALRPSDGESVTITGYVDVYARSGTYQLYAMWLCKAGTGDMYARLEALKKKLYEEGLFDPSRKKRLPMVPRKVAVITSASGAALQDIYNVSAKRSPSIPILLIPVTVQGDQAASEIARGIRTASARTDIDVIIVARGGGSAEDLWCFNEEIIARAVAESTVPVVSGVGHEIDTTICDLAADVRASTPSNAAEIVFPDRKELYGRIHSMRLMLLKAAESKTRTLESVVHSLQARLALCSPERRIHSISAQSIIERSRMNHALRKRINDTASGIKALRSSLDHSILFRTEMAGMTVLRLREKLDALNPLSVLDRGYALVYSNDDRIVSRKAEALLHNQLKVRFSDGEIEVNQDGEPKTGV